MGRKLKISQNLYNLDQKEAATDTWSQIVFFGVATFVKGTIVQGDHGPRGQVSKGQLSKKILV